MIGKHKDTHSWELFPPLRQLVRDDHPLVKLESKLDFSFVREQVAPLYSRYGRPSIPPESVLRIFLIGFLYQIRSERQLLREIEDNLAFRWFCAYPLGEKLPSVSALEQFRKRCGSELFSELMGELANQCENAGVYSLESGRRYHALPKHAPRIRQRSAAERYVGSLFEDNDESD